MLQGHALLAEAALLGKPGGKLKGRYHSGRARALHIVLHIFPNTVTVDSMSDAAVEGSTKWEEVTVAQAVQPLEEHARDNGASSHEATHDGGHEDKEAAAPAPAAPPPADDWDLDLRNPWWTHERLLSVAARTQNGDDWTLHCTLTPDHMRRATADPKPDLDLMQAKAGGGPGRKPSAKGRVIADLAASGEDKFIADLAAAVELPAGACMPLCGGVEIDLKRLFYIVAAHSGSDAVRIHRQWTAVADAVTAALTPNTNRGIVHRTAYEQLLLAYEQLLDAREEYAPLCVVAKQEHADVVTARRAATGNRGRPRKSVGGAPRRYACDMCAQSDLGIIRLFTCDWCERTLCTSCGFADEDEAALDNPTSLRKCADCAQREPNRDYCEVCRSNDGDMINCSSCPAVYHASCASLEDAPLEGTWLCPSCVEGGNAAADAVEALALMDFAQ